MSAIAGIFNQDGRQVAEEQLRMMTRALAPLGPKSESFWRAGNAGLAHRLSWFTKEDEFENQPFTGGDGRFTLVTSARIDNRPELCESLRIAPGDACTMPDSAFIMAALEKWGEECLSRLAGSFALAAYDHRNGDLLLARDAAGEQSLFYWTDGRRLAFASAPKALFALGLMPRKVNLERVADHLVVMPRNPNPHSWYQGLASLDAGSALVVRRDGMRAFQFRTLDPCRETRYARDSDYVEAFCELWQRVVTDYARSRAETGILMSGGLDSTAVAAVAAPSLSRMGRRLAAFTEVPPADFTGAVRPGWYADETPYVRAVANRFANIDLNFIRTNPGFILDGVEEYFAAAEAPLRSGVNRRWIEAICSSAAIQGVPVLLTGQGGNLTISWTGRDLMTQLLTRGHWLRARREAQALTRAGVARSVPAALAAGIVPFLPGPLWSILFRIRYPGRPSYSPGVPWKLRALIAPEFAREQRIAERARQLGHDLRFRRRRSIRTLTLGRETGEGDGARGIESMFGVQLRSPATDPRIVEFCLSLPEDQFLRNGTPRWLIRRAMQGKLPDEILHNPLRGQQSAAWLEQFCLAGNRMNEELDQLDRSPLARLVIDLPRLRNLLGRLRGATDGNPAEVGWLGDLVGTALMTGRFLRWTEGAA